MFDGDSSMARRVSDHGLVEAIVARGHFAGDAIDLAEVRVDGQDARDLGVEGRLVVADVGDAAEQRAGVEMRRVGLEHAIDALARGVVARVVELEFRRERGARRPDRRRS